MLMNEQQIRLNEVILKVKETMDFMCFVQENHAHEQPLGKLEKSLTTYRQLLAELEGEERQVGALPRDPDPEMELVHQFMAKLKPLLGGDRDAVLQEEFRKQKDDLVNCIRAALELEYPGNVRDTLQRTLQYSEQI